MFAYLTAAVVVMHTVLNAFMPSHVEITTVDFSVEPLGNADLEVIKGDCESLKATLVLPNEDSEAHPYPCQFGF
jgi:hypothetical protein